ncbi:cleavage induced protein [Achlya hypogyna]|uniref:Cleavage induced protein n=1 Tax=Achlya hypogyna TaxID=1202772 RepID=A0A1V9ZS32_ACHHY|nr:cleavage induced protein [Achlya hypogyna]
MAEVPESNKISSLQAFAQAQDDDIRETIPASEPAVTKPPKDVAKEPEEIFSEDEEATPKPAERELAPRKTLADVANDTSGSRPTLLQVATEGHQVAPSLLQVAHDGTGRRSLMDVASSSTSNGLSLVDAVKSQETASETLVAVAKTTQLQHQSTIATVLSKVAAEDRRASDRRVASALQVASQEVEAERKASMPTGATLQAAALEVRTERTFVYDPSKEKVDAAAGLLATLSPKHAVNAPPRKPHASVDRDVLKSRQGVGLRHSGPVLKSRRDSLSSFQNNHLTEMQKRLLYATLVEHKPSAKKDKQAQLRLSAPVKPRKRVGKEQYAREEDRKHCRFKPRLGRGSNEAGASRSDDEDEGDNQDFIRRMEAAEKAKNESIRRSREEREYIAQLDKKECPKCGNPQSYSEVKQKRKQCPNCGVAYRSRMAWADVETEFFERVEHFERLKTKKRDDMAAETTPTFRMLQRKVLDPRTSTFVTINLKRLTWKDVEEDFLGRVQLDEMNRILNREELENEFYGFLTFHPSITPHARRMEYVRFEERMQRDIEERAIRKEQVMRPAYQLRSRQSLP